VSTPSYASKFGTKLRNGRVAYKGRNHRHWTRKAYSGRYGCWLWFDPSTGVWYFWAGSRVCFLPVIYISTVDPSEGSDMLPPNADEVLQTSESQVDEMPGEGQE
jgi:hypothetical protein